MSYFSLLLVFEIEFAEPLIETISPFDSDVVIIPSKTLTILNDFFCDNPVSAAINLMSWDFDKKDIGIIPPLCSISL